MRLIRRNHLLAILFLTLTVCAGCTESAPTALPQTRTINLPTARPIEKTATPLVVETQVRPTETVAPQVRPTMTSPPVTLGAAGIGDVVELDGWQFVVDSLTFSTNRPDGVVASEGHQFAVVTFTVKNNSDQCRIWKSTTPERSFDEPRKYNGAQLFVNEFSPTAHPQVVPWVLDSRGYGHAGLSEGMYLGFTFNAPPLDAVPMQYWFDVPTANSGELKLYLEKVSGLSQENLIFDLARQSAEQDNLTPGYMKTPVAVGTEASLGDNWAMTVTGIVQGEGKPYQNIPSIPQTTVIARVKNLQGIDATFPRTETNPQGAKSDFYLINNKLQIAATSAKFFSQLSDAMAPNFEREIQIPLYSPTEMALSELRFTALVDIETCEYAHFELSR